VNSYHTMSKVYSKLTFEKRRAIMLITIRNLWYKFLDGYPTMDEPRIKTNTQLIVIVVYYYLTYS
jgi:hypothetical protein